MSNHFLLGGIGIIAMSLASVTFADEPAPTETSALSNVFSVSGFGTIGAVKSNTDVAKYTSGFQSTGADKKTDFGPDTKFGVQVDARFNPNFSATLQAFSRLTADGTYEPDVEWAFGKFKVTDGIDLRLGRMGAPFYMTSDFRNVGYTNVSVRTPYDVYQSAPNRSYDGGDILYQHDFGDTILNGQLWMGRSTTKTSPDITFLLHNIIGLNLSVEHGPLTVRVGRMKARLDASGSGLANFNTLTADLMLGSTFPGLATLGDTADAIGIDNKYGTFTGVGAVLDLGKFVLNTEYIQRRTESLYVQDQNSWYTTFGYRVDKFTPYISLSQRKTMSAKSIATPTTGPAPFQPLVNQLINAINTGGIVEDQSDKSTAIGVRWDAGKNYDVKAEFQQIRVPAGSTAGFQWFQTTSGKFDTNTNVNLVSICVDFVF